ncbi:hypothetical protein AURDEDRAFT_178984 [Auricularia subglabra TFB-10046 SS5]|nr:hypothetical protein AURDEDRAFT_178984 [Auricularia subglabra TFB-10046 SS5]
MHDQRQALTEMQEGLTAYMVYHPNFEREWLASPQAARDEFILEGLVRTCAAAPDMEPRRMHAPEASLDYLGGRGGRAFLELLAQMENPASPEPRIVPHEGCDAMTGVGDADKRSPEEKIIARGQTLIRNAFLCLMVLNTMLAFHGEKKEYRTTRITNNSKIIRGLRTKSPESHYQRQKAAWQAARWCCKSCGILETDLPDEKHLLICSKCKTAVDRVVKYCSRECQKRDWPNHKLICGKILGADHALEFFGGLTAEHGISGRDALSRDVVGERIYCPPAFPPPLPPFTHSRHLKYQIQLLRNHPEWDYAYVRFEDEQTISGLCLEEGSGRDDFLSVRERAFQGGEEVAVVALYGFLSYFLKGDGASLKKLHTQLSLEYGIDAEVLARTIITFEFSSSES